MKNAITKSLDDPVLEAMRKVIPTESHGSGRNAAERAHCRPDFCCPALIGQSSPRPDIDLVNRQISRRAARNALVALAFIGGLLRRFRVSPGR